MQSISYHKLSSVLHAIYKLSKLSDAVGLSVLVYYELIWPVFGLYLSVLVCIWSVFGLYLSVLVRLVCLVWFVLVRSILVYFGMVWYGLVWFGMV